MGYAIVRLWFKWLLEQPDGKQTDKLGDLYFLEESYEKMCRLRAMKTIIFQKAYTNNKYLSRHQVSNPA